MRSNQSSFAQVNGKSDSETEDDFTKIVWLSFVPNSDSVSSPDDCSVAELTIKFKKEKFNERRTSGTRSHNTCLRSRAVCDFPYPLIKIKS